MEPFPKGTDVKSKKASYRRGRGGYSFRTNYASRGAAGAEEGIALGS